MHSALERTWERDEVRDVLADALQVVTELAPDDDLRLAVFNFAGQLLSQTAVRQTPIGLPTGRLLQ